MPDLRLSRQIGPVGEIGRSSLGPLQAFADFLIKGEAAIAAEKWAL
jgi:hypothetical protein